MALGRSIMGAPNERRRPLDRDMGWWDREDRVLARRSVAGTPLVVEAHMQALGDRDSAIGRVPLLGSFLAGYCGPDWRPLGPLASFCAFVKSAAQRSSDLTSHRDLRFCRGHCTRSDRARDRMNSVFGDGDQGALP